MMCMCKNGPQSQFMIGCRAKLKIVKPTQKTVELHKKAAAFKSLGEKVVKSKIADIKWWQ